MFGNKQEKQERLEREADLLRDETLSQAELARRIAVDKATIASDLMTLNEQGVLIQEDGKGKLHIHKWW